MANHIEKSETGARSSGQQVLHEVSTAVARIEAIFGKVTLRMEHVDALEVVPTDTVSWLPTQVGLVLYYALDDRAAVNRAADKHHGQVTGINWLEQGRRSGAVEFDGSGRLTVPHHPDLCPQKLTLAAWIHPRGQSSSYQVLMAKTNGGSWTQGYGFVRNSGDARICCSSSTTIRRRASKHLFRTMSGLTSPASLTVDV